MTDENSTAHYALQEKARTGPSISECGEKTLQLGPFAKIQPQQGPRIGRRSNQTIRQKS